MKALILSLIAVTCFSTHAESTPQPAPLQVTNWWLSKDTLKPSDRAALTVKVHLDDTFSAYADKLNVQVTQPSGIASSEVIITPLVGFIDFAGKKHTGFRGDAELKLFIETPDSFSSKIEDFSFTLNYTACTKKICLPPKQLVFGKKRETINSDKQTSSSVFDLKDSLQKNIFLALALLFLYGFLTSLTPCVYPLIPITLAVIGARTQGASRTKAFLTSLIYVLGIAVTYSILGVFAAKTGAAFGQALSYPPVVLGYSLIFIVMAFAMFGFFEIKLPNALTQKLSSTKTGSGYGGAFIAGLIAGVIASPCVGPILIGILAYIAETQDALLGFILLFTFAMGMGMLFLALGTFSSLSNKLPRSGSWMDFVKYLLGLSLLGLSYFYLAPILHGFWDSIILALLITTASFVFYYMFARQKKTIVAAAIFLVATISSGYVLLQGYNKHSNSLTTPSSKYINGWQPYSAELVAKAKADNKPVIIDFYADWCVACVELDEITFIDPKMIEASKDFVLLKIDATKSFDGLGQLMKQYNVLGYPTVAFIDKDGVFLKEQSLVGFEPATKFIARMKRILNSNN